MVPIQSRPGCLRSRSQVPSHPPYRPPRLERRRGPTGRVVAAPVWPRLIRAPRRDVCPPRHGRDRRRPEPPQSPPSRWSSSPASSGDAAWRMRATGRRPPESAGRSLALRLRGSKPRRTGCHPGRGRRKIGLDRGRALNDGRPLLDLERFTHGLHTGVCTRLTSPIVGSYCLLCHKDLGGFPCRRERT